MKSPSLCILNLIQPSLDFLEAVLTLTRTLRDYKLTDLQLLIVIRSRLFVDICALSNASHRSPIFNQDCIPKRFLVSLA